MPKGTTAKVRTPGDTDKAKPQIAIDLKMSLAALEDMTLCWVPMPQTDEVKRIMEDVAIVRTTEDWTCKARTVYSEILQAALTPELLEKLKEEGKGANRKTLADMNETELEKKAAAAKREFDRIMAEMAARKG